MPSSHFAMPRVGSRVFPPSRRRRKRRCRHLRRRRELPANRNAADQCRRRGAQGSIRSRPRAARARARAGGRAAAARGGSAPPRTAPSGHRSRAGTTAAARRHGADRLHRIDRCPFRPPVRLAVAHRSRRRLAAPLGALGAAFNAQGRVNAERADKVDAGALPLWLMIAGLAATAISLLL